MLVLYSRNYIVSVVGRQPMATNGSLVLMPDACHVIGHHRSRRSTRTDVFGNIISDYDRWFLSTTVIKTTSIHLQVLQPTVFHDRDFFTFASPLPTVKPRFWALIRPFDTIVWVMNVVTIIASGMIFYVISNIEVNVVDKALN